MDSMFEEQAYTPLADRLRPQKLGDVLGQEHIVGPDGLLSKLVKSNRLTSMILWGPPGTGKTTIARILANETDAEFIEVSAVSMGKAEVREAIKQAENARAMGQSTILFVDEIHRFNKAQQDMFLPYVEKGTITLIGATTENPSFEVISPLLSRSRVLVLNDLAATDIEVIITKGAKLLSPKTITNAAKKLLAAMSDGDARAALGGLEVASSLTDRSITKTHISQAMQRRSLKYDKNGEEHYNVISAFIKSMRGSDQQAALYYLQRMIRAGEDPKFIARRIVIFASEDIGMASPHALTLAVSAFQAVERIGLPEGEYTLTQAVMAMCQAPKSRTAADALYESRQLADQYPNEPIPTHLRNAPTKLMKDLDYGKGYKWQADFKHEKGFLPEAVRGTAE